MRKFLKLFLPLLFLALFAGLNAQIAINSPYTRFGIGEIQQQGFGLSRSMGGTSIAYRFSDQINQLNPASYSAQDTLSFIFDFGLFGEIRKLSTQFEQVKRNDFNMGNLAIGFPVTRWWGASIGILPYSRIGYNMLSEGTFSTSGDIYQIYYEGNGNLNNFYLGSSFRLGGHIAVGANLSYIFGTYSRNKNVFLPRNGTSLAREGSAQTHFINRSTIGDVLFNFGFQGFTKLGNNSNLNIGITLNNKTKLNGEYTSLIINDYPVSVDTMERIENQNGSITIPLRFGVGVVYNYKDKLLFALDYIQQDWSTARFFGEVDSLTTSSSMRFGFQYTPVALTEVKRASYWQRISFRAGAYYNNTYLDINGQQIKDYGMTFGIGIPWKNERNLLTKTSFNISYQLGWRGTLNSGLVKENYQIISIGLTLYDFWFIKPKYD